MFPPELYAAVKRIEASAAPLLRSSAERIVILDTHVVLECTLWRDESEADSPLGCALKAGRIVPAASHETLLELAGVAARPVKQMLEAEAAARALTMLERWGKLIRMPSKDMLTEAAQALDSENVRCRAPCLAAAENQKFLILTKAAANICGVGSTALITRDKLLRKAAKKLRAAERGGAMLLLPEDFTE